MKSRNKFLRLKVENVPDELKAFNNWVVWKAEVREDKITKVPYDAQSGNKARTNDSSTWTSFGNAVKAFESGTYDGIGFCLSKDDLVVGIDLDHCIDMQGNINSLAQHIIKALNSYCELSPSGHGIRIFIKGKLPESGRKKGGVEFYDSGRYLTVTGHCLPDSTSTIEERQIKLEIIHAEIFKATQPGTANKQYPSVENNILQKMFNSKNDTEIEKLYRGDWSAYPSQSEADLALCCHLAFWCGNDFLKIDALFRQSGLYREKWDVKHYADGKTYGQVTIEISMGTTQSDDYLCEHSVDEIQNLQETKNKSTRRTISQAEGIIEIANRFTLFKDQYEAAYIFIGNESFPLKSKKVSQYLSYQYHSNNRKAANNESLRQALDILEGRAIHECRQIELHNRIALKDGAFYFDMGNGEVIETTDRGWNIKDAPILFRRYLHQQRQVIPSRNGNPWALFEFVNVPEAHRLLTLASIISNFIPEIPHPIYHPYGPHGSGKSSLFKIIKSLCDPSSLKTLIFPKSAAELIQILSHHHVCLFDNLSELKYWASDILAIACTGGGFSKRMLFTDDEDIILNIKRVIGLNGINTLIYRPDLMDRTILLYLERIESDTRAEEKYLWESFDDAKPNILGGIFDTLSKAMARYPHVSPNTLSRMADFSRWGYAITEALGRNGEEFIRAYQSNIERQNEEVIQNNTLAQAVLRFMSETDGIWAGTVEGFYLQLQQMITPSKEDKSFPKYSNKLRGALNKIKPNLLDCGITFEIDPYRARDGVHIRVFKDKNISTQSSQPTLANAFRNAPENTCQDEHREDDLTRLEGESTSDWFRRACKASSAVSGKDPLIKRRPRN